MTWWGGFVARRRWWVLLASIVLFVASLGLLSRGGTLNNNDTFHFESSHALTLESQQLPTSIANGFELVLGSPSLTVGSPGFAAAVSSALAPLRRDSRVQTILVPPLDDPTAQSSLISTDRHWVAVEVELNLANFADATKAFPSLRAQVHSSVLTVHAAGDVPLNSAFNVRSEQDLQRADVSIPAALILLVIVFGSLVAALLCLGVGLVAVAGGLAAMYALAHVTDVSTYALNVVVILGLGVAIDYSLFITSRFREELRRREGVEAALSVTMRTAGTAVAFSGITVAVGATALLFYSGTILTSMGLAGSFMVLIAVVYALSFLPALLAILGERVNRWRPGSLLGPLRRSGAAAATRAAASTPTAAIGELSDRGARGFWARLANLVMGHPVAVLVPCLAVLLLAGSPLSQIHLAEADVTLLPPGDDARQGTELLTERFGQGNAIDVVLDFHGSPYGAANVATAYRLGQRLTTFPGISNVTSYVNVPGVSGLTTYQEAYAHGVTGLPATERALVTQLTGSSIAVLRAYTPYAESSDEAQNVIRYIRAHDRVESAQVLVTGNTAFDMDYVQYMLEQTPWAVVYVMVTTFLLLTVLLRSVVLPIKAVLMNLLSLSASFGALVFIFQQGHLSGFLDISAAPLDPTIPVLVFCVVFGLSMDYEVFLLTRMREEWRAHGDNRRAVAAGRQASGRLVTGAAAIMVTVFLVFGLVSSVVVIKALGLGMAIAIFVDASLVRALVVPALMRLIGPVNWWAPRWLQNRNRPDDRIAPA
ncbi:MAG: MMPL family transporter [Candidatus Dormibacteria bacterium]|jgi:RND superfamily putative drug exporter